MAFIEAGVNLTGILGYRKTARTAEMTLVVDETTPGTSAAGKIASITIGKEPKTFVDKGEDGFCASAKLAGRLAEAGINMASFHALSTGTGGSGALAVVEPAVRYCSASGDGSW